MGGGTRDDKGLAIALDPTGHVIVGGSCRPGTTGQDFCVIKYNAATGESIWVTAVDGGLSYDDQLMAMKLDASGNVVLAGKASHPFQWDNFLVARVHGSSGQLHWSAMYDEVRRFDFAYGLDVDSSGNPVVVGRSGDSNDRSAARLIKYDRFYGNVLWTSAYRIADRLAFAHDVKVAPGGAVFVVGETHETNGEARSAVFKYDGDTGALIDVREMNWAERTEATAEGALTLSLDGSGNVLAVGLTGFDIPWHKIHQAKLDPALNVLWTSAFPSAQSLSGPKFDFNLDARSDILWRNDATGENYIYHMNGTAILPSEGFIRSVPTPWTVAGSGDFNGDGRADILWRNTTTGENYIYFMDGRTNLPNEGYIRSVPTNWRVDGVADFDGDAKADILWRNTTTGENYLYFMDGRIIKPNEGFIRSVSLVWAPVTVGDFDGDGKADILWHHNTTGENYLYFMDGRVIKPTEGFIRSVPTNWVVGGSGDFDGDNRADILWRNTATGENYLYFMDGRVIKPNEGYIRSVATVWIPASVADFDGDGKADILWRNTGNGQNYVYPMDGRVIKPGEGFTRSVPIAWEVMTK